MLDPFPYIHLHYRVCYLLRSGIVHSEMAEWNTLDFSDIAIVLIILFKARLEKSREEVEAYVSVSTRRHWRTGSFQDNISVFFFFFYL